MVKKGGPDICKLEKILSSEYSNLATPALFYM